MWPQCPPPPPPSPQAPRCGSPQHGLHPGQWCWCRRNAPAPAAPAPLAVCWLSDSLQTPAAPPMAWWRQGSCQTGWSRWRAWRQSCCRVPCRQRTGLSRWTSCHLLQWGRGQWTWKGQPMQESVKVRKKVHVAACWNKQHGVQWSLCAPNTEVLKEYHFKLKEFSRKLNQAPFFFFLHLFFFNWNINIWN